MKLEEDESAPVEIVHSRDGITFWSVGDHPTLWTFEGDEIDAY
ncbi:hypothetical protein [Acrocarpospora macrocephala]|nr:hypothetical protein [Acrocarpospora macrocephala]